MKVLWKGIAAAAAAVLLAGCTASPRFTAARSGNPDGDGSYSISEEGMASYYADEFNGRKTSNGETYDMNGMTAAHRTLPFNTTVRVTNLGTGSSVQLRINDRGPFKDDRIVDVSLAAARRLDMISGGTARVRLDVIELGPAQPARR